MRSPIVAEERNHRVSIQNRTRAAEDNEVYLMDHEQEKREPERETERGVEPESERERERGKDREGERARESSDSIVQIKKKLRTGSKTMIGSS